MGGGDDERFTSGTRCGGRGVLGKSASLRLRVGWSGGSNDWSTVPCDPASRYRVCIWWSSQSTLAVDTNKNCPSFAKPTPLPPPAVTPLPLPSPLLLLLLPLGASMPSLPGRVLPSPLAGRGTLPSPRGTRLTKHTGRPSTRLNHAFTSLCSTPRESPGAAAVALEAASCSSQERGRVVGGGGREGPTMNGMEINKHGHTNVVPCGRARTRAGWQLWKDKTRGMTVQPTTPHHTTPQYTTIHHITSHYTISHHTISSHTKSHHTKSHHRCARTRSTAGWGVTRRSTPVHASHGTP